MFRIIASLFIILMASPLQAQQPAQLPPGYIFGNDTAATRVGRSATLPAMFNRAFPNPNPGAISPFTAQIPADIASAPLTTGAYPTGTSIATPGGVSGHSYAPGDTLTVVGGTLGTAATFSVQTVQMNSATLGSGGSGYAPNDQLQVLGGAYYLNTNIKVLTVSGGVIQTFQIIASSPGNYTGTLPAPPLATAPITGSGTGATLVAPIWGVATVALAGSGNYTNSAFPANPVATTSPTGTGATLNVAWGNAPQSLRTALGNPAYEISFSPYSHQPCKGYQFGNNWAFANGASDVNLLFCNNDPSILYPNQTYTGGDQTTLSFGAAQNVTFQTTDSTRVPVNNVNNVLNPSLFNLIKIPYYAGTQLLTAPANGSGIYSLAQASTSFGLTSTCGVVSGGSANCAVDTNYSIITTYIVNNSFTWDGSTPGTGPVGRLDIAMPAGRQNGLNWSVVDFSQGIYCGTGANGLLSDQGFGNVNCLQFTISSALDNHPKWTLHSTGLQLGFYNNGLAADQWLMNDADGGLYAAAATGGSKGAGTINAHTGIWIDNVRLTNCSPVVNTFGSGSGTYTSPTCNSLAPKYITALLVGAGGGSPGSGTTPGAGGAGGDTCIKASGTACSTPLYAAGGGAAGSAVPSASAAGGAVSGSGTCDVALPGLAGGAPSNQANAYGGIGGGGSPPGVGSSSPPAVPAMTGFGAGGPGQQTNANAGGGGGEGAHCLIKIFSPGASYAYTVGVGGTGGTLGTGGTAGVAGGTGRIEFTAYFQ